MLIVHSVFFGKWGGKEIKIKDRDRLWRFEPPSEFLRRDGDSNPGTALDGYTLSRRASSATRASLLDFRLLTISYPQQLGHIRRIV